MAEQIDITTPIQPPSLSSLTFGSVLYDWADSRIVTELIYNTGEKVAFGYGGATALSLMIAINKANCSTISQQKRIYNQLIADGKVIGTVSGTPA